MAENHLIRLRDDLRLYPQEGTLEFLFRGYPLLQGITARALYRAGAKSRCLSLRRGGGAYGVGKEGAVLSCENEELALEWHLVAREGGRVEMWLEATNKGHEPLRMDGLVVFHLSAEEGGKIRAGPASQWRFYQNGWQSWSPAFARRVSDGLYLDPGTEEYRLMHRPHSRPSFAGDREPAPGLKALSGEWFAVLTLGNDALPALLLGFVTAADQLAEIRLEVKGDEFRGLDAICHLDGVLLPPGERLFSERLLVALAEEPLSLLEEYAARLGEAMDARCPRRLPTGWCTWYYFFGQDTEADVLANLREMERQELPLEYVLIDDGYQRAIGDWLSVDEDKFPRGLKWLAEEIRRAGRRPGLWTAPFAVEAHARLYAQHPDWVLRDEEGRPVLAWQHFGADAFALDLSIPEVQEWLFDTFRTLRWEWGFELFKVDFLYAAALEGKRSDPRMTRAQSLRRGLEVIREAIGEDAFLLACGAPLGPCVGLVDGMRIGPDVDVNWRPLWADLSRPATLNALRNAITRAFLHGHLWANDPDCLLVRQRGDDLDLVLNEMRSLVTIVGLCGGLAFGSDNLPTIRKGRLKYLRQALPPYGQTAKPLDLFQNELPHLLLLPIRKEWGEWTLLALVNWEDHTVVSRLNLRELGLTGRYHAYHYWRRRYLGVVEGEVVIPRHQPHETVLLLLKPLSEEPSLLTSTFHITQGGVEVTGVERLPSGEGEQTLVVVLEKAGVQRGMLLFAIPEPWQVRDARLNGRRRGINQVAAGVVSMGFTLRGRAVAELRLRKRSRSSA